MSTGHFFHGELRLPRLPKENTCTDSYIPSRLWVHTGTGPKTIPSTSQSLPRNGRRDGRTEFTSLQPLQESMLYGLHRTPQKCQSDLEPDRPDGGCEHSRYPSRAGQGGIKG